MNATKGDIMWLSRKWAMPNKETFSIKPIKELIEYWISLKNEGLIIDPFARNSRIADVTNDLDSEYDTDYHLDALEFLQTFQDESISMVLFDPPYSPRQVSEVYKKIGRSVNMQTTQSSYWGNLKKEISRVTGWGSRVITCGWNSGGIGMKYGFAIEQILLVPHGGWHNDTIITVECRELRKEST